MRKIGGVNMGLAEKLSKKDYENLKAQSSEIIKKAKKRGIVKPHVVAFRDFPVKEEIHKGDINYFKKEK